MKFFSSENLATLFLCASIGVGALRGQEPFDSVNSSWPTIRGPALNGQSPETGITESWPKDGIVCHDSETGLLIWRYDLSSGYDEHSAWPIYDEPYLWITGPFQRGSELLEITGDIKQPIRTARTSK